MSTALQLHPLQIEALNNGATKLLFVIDEKLNRNNFLKNFYWEVKDNFILDHAPLQKGDTWFHQERFVYGMNEEFDNIIVLYSECIPAERDNYKWQPASEMTYEQSRLKGTCINVEVKRVKALDWSAFNLGDGANVEYWFNQQYGEGAYQSNPYCFIETVKMKG